MLANGAVLIGIIFAVVQLLQTKQIESIRLAVDAKAPTRAPEFLNSYNKLLDAYNRDPEMLNTESLRDDLSFVMNVYDNIAVLYLHKLADRSIIEERVHDGMTRLEPVLKAMKWPAESRVNFDAVLKRMSEKTKKRKI